MSLLPLTIRLGVQFGTSILCRLCGSSYKKTIQSFDFIFAICCYASISICLLSRVLHDERSDASSKRSYQFDQFDQTWILQAALIGGVVLRQSRPPIVETTRRSTYTTDWKDEEKATIDDHRILCAMSPTFCFVSSIKRSVMWWMPLVLLSPSRQVKQNKDKDEASWGFRLLPHFSFLQLLTIKQASFDSHDLTHDEHKDNCRLSRHFQSNYKQANRHLLALLFL